VSEVEWEVERETLLERLRKAEQIAAESQAEAAVYRELVEDWREAATQAIAKKDFSLLYKINRRIPPFYLPGKEEGELWGKLFLHAYIRDARWLGHTKQTLEQIRADAENLSVEDNEANTILKKKIISAVEAGLIEHI
jgi:hypothetical protein